MKVWTVIEEDESGGFSPWNGLWATKDGALRSIAERAKEQAGADFYQSGELEQVVWPEDDGDAEQWMVSFNSTTYTIVRHTETNE